MAHQHGDHRVAVLGGDKREVLIADWLSQEGFCVTAYGTRERAQRRYNVARGANEAVDRACAIVTPMPGIANGNELYAPHCESGIRIDRALLMRASEGALFFGGHCTEQMREAGAPNSIRWCPMGGDDYIQVQHAIPTAEAALALAIRETDETLNARKCLVIGYGRIGSILAADLRGIGARVTVAARRRESRARATAAGHDVADTAQLALEEVMRDSEIVFNTSPHPLITATMLSQLEPGSLLIDLASPPGGLDHADAEKRGLNVIWARGQADGAAAHSARAQYEFIITTLRDARILETQ